MNREIILLVDDCQLTLDVISELLLEHEFGVLTSSNAGIAMSMICREKIDLVISEMKMPDIDGIQLLEQIHNFKPDLPVIFMTGYADQDMTVNAINSGAFDIIMKPFDTANFINMARKAFDYIKLKKLESELSKHYLVEKERDHLTKELNNALAEIKPLSGMLPICSCCKKIRDDKGNWEQAEIFIQDRLDAEFSHGYCPECAHTLYPKYFKNK